LNQIIGTLNGININKSNNMNIETLIILVIGVIIGIVIGIIITIFIVKYTLYNQDSDDGEVY
jgi:ABC-type antimicrobial peptide transport system permease subunit